MPVFLLNEALSLPDPRLAERDGLLAVGGDLRPERLVLAYRQGIFPWSSDGEPLLWWCPAPRMVLFPDELYVGRSLRKAIRREVGRLRITFDRDFAGVMAGCAEVPRPGQDGTWITAGILAGMTALHDRGIVHSVEVWDGDALVAGLYGLALGRVFCGESMFTRRPNASKIAFVALVRQLQAWGYAMIDCQQVTAHLRRFGARELAKDDFLARLARHVDEPGHPKPWAFDPPGAARWLDDGAG